MIVMPFLDQSDLVASNDLRKFIDLVRSKAIIAGQLKRLEPELGLFIVAFHMNVRRLPPARECKSGNDKVRCAERSAYSSVGFIQAV